MQNVQGEITGNVEKKKRILYSRFATSSETPMLVKWLLETKIIRSEILAAYLLVAAAIVFSTLAISITKNTLEHSQNSIVKYPANAIPGETALEKEIIEAE